MRGNARLTVFAAVATVGASASFATVYRGFHWLMPVFGGIVVVAVTAGVVRQLRLPAAVGPLLCAATETCYLSAVFAPRLGYARVIPSRASLSALGQVARSGFTDIRTLATPVPTHQGLVLLGVIAMAAVALVVDMFAVTMRRAAMAGLPLLAVFAVCTSLARHGAGWISFIIGAAGYLWLLVADSRERVSAWGRPLGRDTAVHPRTSWSDPPAAPSPLSILGRRIGVTAIVIGALLPAAVPGLRGGIPKGGSGTGSGHGSDNVVTINPLVTVRGELLDPQNTPVLRVRTSDPSPGYLRLTSLDHFDGTTFAPSTLVATAKARVSHGINVTVPTGSAVTSKISVGGLAVHWLPLPTQVTDVSVQGDWRYDPGSNTVFSARSDTRSLTYTATSVPVQPDPTALNAAPRADTSALATYLELPPLPDSVRALAARLAHGQRSAFAVAVAIQTHLTSRPFVYDTTVPASDSTTALAQFLFDTHRGFCQQYATAMAVLARLDGIPSRVAVGFTRGTQRPDGSWVVTVHDAHAWPELYFPGFGWLGFEPTPRTDGQTATPAFTRPATSPVTSSPIPPTKPSTPKNRPGSPLSIEKNIDAASDGSVATLPAPSPVHHSGTSWPWPVLLTIAVLALTVPASVRRVTRWQRWRVARTPSALAHAAWSELRASAIDAGVAWQDGHTPQSLARVLSFDCPLDDEQARALGRLVDAEQRARYAADPDALSVASLHRDVGVVAAAVAGSVAGVRRYAHRIWPRSALLTITGALGRALDVVDRAETASARLRAQLIRRGTASSSGAAT
jgi:transglutaminase-like putative cysteine protease